MKIGFNKVKDMVKFSFIIFLFILCFSVVCVTAQDEEELPPGMEYLQVTATHKVLVPKGTQLMTNKGVAQPEGIRAFVGRKLEEVEEHFLYTGVRFDEMKQQISAVEESIIGIKAEIARISITLDKLLDEKKTGEGIETEAEAAAE
ncbi:MAG: hypothetical protein ABIH19_03295 [Candidatus Omnitrophota bacterium]